MSVPGGTYLVTRTTVMSLFLLTPNAVVNQIMEYCLAWAAQGRGILIHAVSVESNHYHMVVTDVEGRLSDFMQEFNRCSARCLIAYYRERFPTLRLDCVWSGAQSFCDTLLLTRNAILRELTYTFTNPVKDGLVSDYRTWPGFNIGPGDWRAASRSVERPAFYFKKTPKVLTYRVVPPRQLEGDLEQVIADAERQILEEQQQAATDLTAQGRSFVGVEAVLSVNPLDAPTTIRPHGNLTPRLASGGDGQAMKLGIEALKRFRTAYRQAWRDFKRGLRAVFPGGTLLMRTRYGLPCEPLDACWCEVATA